MSNYFRNGSGYADPVPAKVIDKQIKQSKQIKRDIQVNNAIARSLSVLKKNDLILTERMIIKDLKTNKIYK